jgi:hypothetical protein
VPSTRESYANGRLATLHSSPVAANTPYTRVNTTSTSAHTVALGGSSAAASAGAADRGKRAVYRNCVGPSSVMLNRGAPAGVSDAVALVPLPKAWGGRTRMLMPAASASK